MLLAVEGGGFFSSSVSGYSKGLTLLLLGQKSEDKPMRVTPWNQYQLVDQEAKPDIQLDSHKNCLVRGCASFVCFGRATAGHESPSLKVGPTQQQEVLPEVCPTHEEKDLTSPSDDVEEKSIKRITIKSSLRKPKNGIDVSCGGNEEHEVLGEEGDKVDSEVERRKVQLAVPSSCDKEHEKSFEKDNEVSASMKSRKVQWTDTAGGELAEIREFEPSDDGGSDDEFEHGSEKTCSCTIM